MDVRSTCASGTRAGRTPRCLPKTNPKAAGQGRARPARRSSGANDKGLPVGADHRPRGPLSGATSRRTQQGGPEKRSAKGGAGRAGRSRSTGSRPIATSKGTRGGTTATRAGGAPSSTRSSGKRESAAPRSRAGGTGSSRAAATAHPAPSRSHPAGAAKASPGSSRGEGPRPSLPTQSGDRSRAFSPPPSAGARPRQADADIADAELRGEPAQRPRGQQSSHEAVRGAGGGAALRQRSWQIVKLAAKPRNSRRAAWHAGAVARDGGVGKGEKERDILILGLSGQETSSCASRRPRAADQGTYGQCASCGRRPNERSRKSPPHLCLTASTDFRASRRMGASQNRDDSVDTFGRQSISHRALLLASVAERKSIGMKTGASARHGSRARTLRACRSCRTALDSCRRSPLRARIRARLRQQAQGPARAGCGRERGSAHSRVTNPSRPAWTGW